MSPFAIRRVVVLLAIIAVSLILFLQPPSAMAQNTADYEKILLPVVMNEERPGAYGSRWTTRLSIVNRANFPVMVLGYEQYCPLSSCFPSYTPERIVFSPGVQGTSSIPARFLFVQRPHGGRVDVQLRAQDVARQSQTWGTEIPVIRSRDALTESAGLLQIPVSQNFRSTLRIYDFDPVRGATPNAVRVRVFRQSAHRGTWFSGPLPAPDPLVTEVERSFLVDHAGVPGYIELPLEALTVAASSDQVWVEVEPITSGLRFWAFVTVVNNETQHITTITPASNTNSGQVSFRQLAAETQSGIKARRVELINTPARFAEVWSEIHSVRTPKPPLPLVDFAQESVVIAAMGERADACWTMAIEGIQREGSNMYVQVKESRRPMSCVCPAVTVSAVHVVAIPRAEGPIESSWRSVIEGAECR